MTLVIDRSAKSEPAQPAVVSVNGVVIPRTAIFREIQNHPANMPAAAWQSAAQALVVRELLLQEARRLGIAAEALVDAEGRRETDEEALVRSLVEREVATPEADERSCRRYYEKNAARFRSPDVYEAVHILFAARRDDRRAFAQAQSLAEASLAELRRHPERFAKLAQIHSGCPSGAQGGNLGQITADQTTPEFERALFALQPGQLTDTPVETCYGLHIIRLDRKIEGRRLPFEWVADRIAGYLCDVSSRRATAQYIARLVSQAVVMGIAIDGAEAHRVN
jgi:peptidyl-prolyl cis-trans isomerase C